MHVDSITETGYIFLHIEKTRAAADRQDCITINCRSARKSFTFLPLQTQVQKNQTLKTKIQELSQQASMNRSIMTNKIIEHTYKE